MCDTAMKKNEMHREDTFLKLVPEIVKLQGQCKKSWISQDNNGCGNCK